jgi:hypothetical protein
VLWLKAAQVHNLVMRYAVRGVHHIEAEMRLAVHEVPHTEAEMHFVVDGRYYTEVGCNG